MQRCQTIPPEILGSVFMWTMNNIVIIVVIILIIVHTFRIKMI